MVRRPSSMMLRAFLGKTDSTGACPAPRQRRRDASLTQPLQPRNHGTKDHGGAGARSPAAL
eukprot:1953560-Alexandrium_andersonii.AAC.1